MTEQRRPIGYFNGERPPKKELLEWLQTQSDLCAAHCVFEDADMFTAAIDYLTMPVADYATLCDTEESRHKTRITSTRYPRD
jgi:hypothetical protein